MSRMNDLNVCKKSVALIALAFLAVSAHAFDLSVKANVDNAQVFIGPYGEVYQALAALIEEERNR